MIQAELDSEGKKDFLLFISISSPGSRWSGNECREREGTKEDAGDKRRKAATDFPNVASAVYVTLGVPFLFLEVR